MSDDRAPSNLLRSCRICKWWDKARFGMDEGRCRRHAPFTGTGDFPVTYGNEWCGEWERKRSVEQRDGAA